MTAARKPRDARADAVTDTEWAFLFGARDAPGVDGGEWWSLQYDDPIFRPGRPSVSDLWRDYGSDVLRAWVAERPGTRPPLWWTREAPEPQRRRLGGVGTLLADCLPACSVTTRLGIPGGWLPADIAKYCRGEDPNFEWPGVDSSDPPVFESQATFLVRHNLLIADEKRRLRSADFEPEEVATAE